LALSVDAVDYLGRKNEMSFILGMDAWVFAAWVLTILAAVLCVIYGIYYEFFKKSNEKKSSIKKDKQPKKKEAK